jgi:hypothetical protein
LICFQAETATNGHEDVSSESTPDGSETAQKPEDQVSSNTNKLILT